MFGALSRKFHLVYMESISTCKVDLRKLIIYCIVEDELYVQIKHKLQQHKLEKRYEGYHLEGDGLLVYKNKIYFPNVAYLRRIVMDEIHKIPYSGHPGYHKIVGTASKKHFLVENE